MIVEFKDVKYVYNENRPNETVAINGINLEINREILLDLSVTQDLENLP